MTSSLEENAGKVGLHRSSEKTKILSTTDMGDGRIKVNNQDIENLDRFTYLGSTIAVNGSSENTSKLELENHMAHLKKKLNIWKSNKIAEKLKLKLFTSIVLPCLLYACETWESTCKINHKLDVFQQRCLRKIFKIRYFDHITNETVLERAKQQKLHELVSERRMKFVGHVLRMNENKLPKIAINWKPCQGNRKRGRPRITWRRTVADDLKSREITWDEAVIVAADRNQWKSFAALCPAKNERT